MLRDVFRFRRPAIVLGLFVLVITIFGASREAFAVSCASMNDPWSAVCYDFESGNLNGWPATSGVSVVSPGLDASNKKLQLSVQHIASGCPEGEATGATGEPPGFRRKQRCWPTYRP